MGEELKKTGAGNLFTVFGEPDIDIETRGRRAAWSSSAASTCTTRHTGEVRTDDTDQIALWMIDTDYNGESFFVRHCYFTGGQDPYKRLKTRAQGRDRRGRLGDALRDRVAAVPAPGPGKIAVKVINDYGDEVMKVFEV